MLSAAGDLKKKDRNFLKGQNINEHLSLSPTQIITKLLITHRNVHAQWPVY